MKQAMVLLVALMAFADAAHAAACRIPQLQESVEVRPGRLSLADLLPPGNCPALDEAAARVSLGEAPHKGSERVLEGAEIRMRLEQLASRLAKTGDIGPAVAGRIPERIIVRLAETGMACGEVAAFLAGAVPDLARDAGWQSGLHCGGAHNVAAGAVLSLTKTSWNPLLGRREFILRCQGAAECVPFLVWLAPASDGAALAALVARIQPEDPVVRRGQTAMLTWDQGGIRVVVPVTCLEAGGIGQSIRVRIQNAERTLRAQVVGAGALRVSL
jgi:hypothetical protein